MIGLLLPAGRFSTTHIEMLRSLFAKVAAGLTLTDENDLMMLAHEMVRLVDIVGLDPDALHAEAFRLFAKHDGEQATRIEDDV